MGVAKGQHARATRHVLECAYPLLKGFQYLVLFQSCFTELDIEGGYVLLKLTFLALELG